MVGGDFFLGAAIASVPLYGVRFTFLGVPLNIPEALVLCAAMWLIGFGAREFLSFAHKIFNEQALTMAVILLFGGVALSALADHVLSPRELGIINGWFAVPLIFGILIAWRAHSENLRNFFLWIWIGTALAVALASLWYWGVGDLTYDGRLRGFYLSPNHLALFLAPAVSAGALFLALIATNRKLVIAGITLLGLMGGALLLTFSQAALIAVVGGVAVGIVVAPMPRRKKQWWFFSLTTLIILAAALFLASHEAEDFRMHSERSSFASRLMIYRAATMIGAEHPFVGIGPGNFQDAYLDHQKYFPSYLEWAVPQPHNIFLAFWLQTGISGLCGFLLLLIVWTRKIFSTMKAQRNAAVCVVALGAAMVTILLHGFVDTPYWKNDLAFSFWFLIGLGVALFFSAEDARKTNEPRR